MSLIALKDAFISWEHNGGSLVLPNRRVSLMPTKIPLYRPNKGLWIANADLLTKSVEVIPLGWLMYREKPATMVAQSPNTFGLRPKTSGKPHSAALFSLFYNKQETFSELYYGMMVFPDFESRSLPSIGSACNGLNRFGFRVELAGARYEDFTETTFNDATLLAYWANLQKTPGSPGDKRSRNPNADMLGIYLTAEQKTPLLTYEQYSGLANFVNYYSAAFHGLSFSTFARPIPDMQKAMQHLATISDKTIKAWIDQFLCEMLVHPIHSLRVVAKAYYDANPKDLSNG